MSGSGGAAQGAMQTSLANQGLAANQINANSASLTSQAGMLNSPLPATMSGISSAIASGGNQSGTTGVNQNAVGQQAIGYETNTGGTNLAQANSGLSSFYKNEQQQGLSTPGVSNFYQSEMANGLNQQTQNNAQNQLQQQFGQSEAAIKNSAAPGTNTANQQQQAQNQLISGSTNLAGSLAGQSQAIQAQGAQGVSNTALQNQQSMQQGAQGVASTAGGLDTQTMQMLQNALSGSQGLNSTTLQNLISVLGLGTASAGQASNDIANANQAQGGLFSGYSGQAAQFGQQAASNSQSSGLGGILGSAAGLFSPIKL